MYSITCYRCEKVIGDVPITPGRCCFGCYWLARARFLVRYVWLAQFLCRQHLVDDIQSILLSNVLYTLKPNEVVEWFSNDTLLLGPRCIEMTWLTIGFQVSHRLYRYHRDSFSVVFLPKNVHKQTYGDMHIMVVGPPMRRRLSFYRYDDRWVGEFEYNTYDWSDVLWKISNNLEEYKCEIYPYNVMKKDKCENILDLSNTL